MSGDWSSVIGVSLVLALGMGAVSALRRRGALAPEYSRKLLHVGMGLLTLAFPLLFAEPAPVLFLAGIAVLWFAAVRYSSLLRRHFSSALCDVSRSGWGEAHFAVGAGLAFLIADGDSLCFFLSVAILTFADAVAALIGQRYGVLPGAIRFGGKSLAGSTAFFAVALVCSVVVLHAAGWPVERVTAVAITLAALTTGLEAISERGFDNLWIPVGAALLLRHMRDPGSVLPWSLLLPLAVVIFAAAAVRLVAKEQT